ncbi:LysE family translocator [Vibrio scophthalmi]|uniref:Leucine efflux protein n=1 Tax=Vibrio scophthalmi TaxID=45658 RepID=A0A1E3WPM3_9VIBR|nr:MULTISPECIES: LysE family translocator [Vibrio]EGU35664.1 homoserine/homoserine lactone efflux protein [Vibrio sp. N418]MCY9803531.1 LysE family translocator [Vibrio scophthalmi]ODS11447.1 Leucine efflux protein [Vibrio scophthalmi]
MTIDTLVAFAGIVFFLAIIPGPNALLILYTSLTQGKRFAVVNTLGVSVGFLVHAFISAQGLSLLLSQSAMAFSIFKWLGVAYLFWLGINNVKAALNQSELKIDPKKSTLTPSLSSSFIKGLLTNLLNPKIVLFYLSIFPQFVSPQHILEQSMLLGLTQAMVVSSWFLVVILFASKLKAMLTTPKVTKWLNYVSGGLFVSFGVSLASARL